MIYNAFIGLFKFIALPVAKVRGNRLASQVARWTLHVCCVLAILACLAVLNYVLDLEKVLRVSQPLLRKSWLPLLFLQFYALAWLGWWLWQLLSAEREPSKHPDLDDAWSQATQALEQAGIDLLATPLFLVLGRPAGGEQSLMAASRLPLVVPQTPRSPQAPLHAYATAEGVYITCSGSSLLGRHAAVLAEETARRHETPADDSSSTEPADLDQPLDWSQPEFTPPEASDWTQPNFAEGGLESEHSVAVLNEPERPKPAAPAPPRVAAEPKSRYSLLKHADEVAQCTERLRHVCGLIARDRRPYCPLNGLLVLVPYAATESDADANEAAILIERDLEAVEETLNLSCPVVALVCDLEQAAGCQEFIERLPEEQRRRRLGVAFPPVAPSDAARIPAVLEEGLQWLCQSLLPSLIYRLLQAGGKDERPLRGNCRLYLLLDELRQRQARLCRILTRGINPDGQRPWLPRGCYLAATGAEALGEQGFAAGVFPQLVELQNAVSWTPAALADDASCRFWSRLGYAGLAAFVAAVATLLLSL